MTKSSVLYATPSFIRGMAATLDLGSTLTIYNTSRSETEADMIALSSDWLIVGEDIEIAMNRWSDSNVAQTKK